MKIYTSYDIEISNLAWIRRVREEFIKCHALEMDKVYEIPINDWKSLENAIMCPAHIVQEKPKQDK